MSYTVLRECFSHLYALFFRGSMIDMPTVLQAKNILEFDYVIRGEALPDKYKVDPNTDDVIKEN